MPRSSFAKLALSTTAATYLLILVGGLVRASGAGLGCPDWPRCFGTWIPPLDAADIPSQFDVSQFNPTLMWTEYLNRLLGAAIGLLIFATLVSAIRNHRREPRILWPTLTAFLLVGFQGWLGGVVVEHELAPWIVTIHLLVALVIVSLLLYATVFSLFLEGGVTSARGRHRRQRSESRRRLMWSVLILMCMTLVQIGLGAQVRGGIDDALIQGTPRSAALASVGSFDRWHRETALVVVGAALWVTLLVWSRHDEWPIVRTSYLVCGLVLLQAAFGIAMAYLSLTPALQIAHLTAASLLLGAETVLALLALWLPEQSRD